MHNARAFFCAGIVLLALSYHLGARNATAQAPGNPVIAIANYGGQRVIAVTSSGDAYDDRGSYGAEWTRTGNVFGTPTPALRETWGAVKSRYRGEREAARPTQDR